MKLLVHYDHPERVRDVLRKRLADVPVSWCRDYASLPALLEHEKPDVLFTVRFAGSEAFPREAIRASRSLRWISVGGSGTDHLGMWDSTRLTVTNAAGVGAETMAQYALAAMLHFTLGLPAFATRQRERRWAPGRVASVAGRTLAILGLGKTGQSTAKLAKALGLSVIGIRAHPQPTPSVDRVEPTARLPDILAEADFVLVCLPLTAATRGLIDKAAFAALKPGAVLIDVSRGGIVRQDALIETLSSGRLRGAALDVFEIEPLPADSPLWRMENVIVTPHSSSVYDGWERRAMEMFCDNAERWQRGEPLENIVDPHRGY
ncbi:MAG: D-2-hydroxyacid dehydrogenase [Methylobacteriaceae bacterium]|nr:D-2-hydroxyacid dehydrogenase [Methylobacteriaceae bacterium]